jgi:DNA-directed RNA polymerase specialized sigma24 family protein
MNRFLDRQARHIALDDLSNDNFNKTMKTQDSKPVEQQLSLLELLDCMDEETRHISNLRFQGYSMTEIAGQLSISSNTLSARYRRGIARATANIRKRAQKRVA